MAHDMAAHHDDHDGHGHDDGAVHAHVSSVKFYVGIFLALIALTLLTVGVSYVHLGPANLAVAVVIASLKATLVVMFFMHLRYDSKFNAVIFISGLLFIGVFFAYTLNDTGRRGEVDDEQGTTVLPSTGKLAPGGYEAPVHHAEGAGHEATSEKAEHVEKGEKGGAAETVGKPATGEGHH